METTWRLDGDSLHATETIDGPACQRIGSPTRTTKSALAQAPSWRRISSNTRPFAQATDLDDLQASVQASPSMSATRSHVLP